MDLFKIQPTRLAEDFIINILFLLAIIFHKLYLMIKICFLTVIRRCTYNTPTVTAVDYFLKSLGVLRKFELLNNQLYLHLSFNFRDKSTTHLITHYSLFRDWHFLFTFSVMLSPAATLRGVLL